MKNYVQKNVFLGNSCFEVDIAILDIEKDLHFFLFTIFELLNVNTVFK